MLVWPFFAASLYARVTPASAGRISLETAQGMGEYQPTSNLVGEHPTKDYIGHLSDRHLAQLAQSVLAARFDPGCESGLDISIRVISVLPWLWITGRR